jgi:hypothetical protein
LDIVRRPAGGSHRHLTRPNCPTFVTWSILVGNIPLTSITDLVHTHLGTTVRQEEVSSSPGMSVARLDQIHLPKI